MRCTERPAFPTRRLIATFAAILALGAAADDATAAPGVTTRNINMRAGPDVAYPLVAALPQGTPVEILGCLDGWNWCDSQTGGARGWIAGPGLAVFHGQEPEPLAGYGRSIGLPFVGFDFNTYWGRHYRDRPWFNQGDRWHSGPPPRAWRDGPGPGFGAPGHPPFADGQGGGQGGRPNFNRDRGGNPGSGGWPGPRDEDGPNRDPGFNHGGDPYDRGHARPGQEPGFNHGGPGTPGFAGAPDQRGDGYPNQQPGFDHGGSGDPGGHHRNPQPGFNPGAPDQGSGNPNGRSGAGGGPGDGPGAGPGTGPGPGPGSERQQRPGSGSGQDDPRQPRGGRGEPGRGGPQPN